ncbi:DUF1294 domain-containing protein [Pseudoalteromonas sp. S16_S37]|uniref:DUF1294 domain-containing protein n=1 Tax=Pseudoalteromonas sp. S16_S37 TaxID=2720228 RepID=UPI001680DBB2|nr:DUF1294 domain-containing protein [Pseudoalteromonas sp. S16_S37]MBD1583001.1 DUF1294 domain-containing protein [Pseudoalteromonas sp. S16_S37]
MSAFSVNVLFKALSYSLSRCNWLLIALVVLYLASNSGYFMFLTIASTAYFATINVLFIWLFWLDKRRAQHAAQRVSEISLICLSGLGANISMFAAQKQLHHKTQKQAFNAKLCALTLLQSALLLCLCYWLFI